MSAYAELRSLATVRIIARPESLVTFEPILRVRLEFDEKSSHDTSFNHRRWNVIYVRTAGNGSGYNARSDGRLYRLTPERLTYPGNLRCEYLSGAQLDVTSDFGWCRCRPMTG